ncbi:MAG: ribosome assembly RNA-binding protein YhbY [Lachnospiraceae bacterium]|nr:ribosome assembly RNA-binding protein YhbY [Lachnospiraceae bacterium]
MKFTSKQRAYLRSLASTEETVLHIGKEGVTPEVVQAVDEAIDARELIKVGLLKNCFDDPNEVAEMVSERTRSTLVQVIGRKIVLYRKNRDNPKIELPRAKQGKS